MFEHCYASSQITILKGNNGFLFQAPTKIFLIWNENSNMSSSRANENTASICMQLLTQHQERNLTERHNFEFHNQY